MNGLISLFQQSKSISPDFDALQNEIIDRFENNIPAHWDKDVDFIVNELGKVST